MAAEQPGQLEQLANEHDKLQPYKDAFRKLDQEVNQKLNDINNKAELYKEKPWYKRLINKIRGKNEPNLTPDQFKKFSEDIKDKIQQRYSKFIDTVRTQSKYFDSSPTGADFAIKDAMAELKKGLDSMITEEVKAAALAAGRGESPKKDSMYASQASDKLSLSNMGAVQNKNKQSGDAFSLSNPQ